MSNTNEQWKLKQEWLENVMASDLSSATKVFAFAIAKAAYGEKITSFPGTDTIKLHSNLSPGHYTNYRHLLVGCGALSISKKRAGKYKQEHCEYEMNLAWDGSTQPNGDSHTSTRKSSTPARESSTSTGCSKTSMNTSTEDINEDIKVFASSSSIDVSGTSKNYESPIPTHPPIESGKEVPLSNTTPSGGMAIKAVASHADNGIVTDLLPPLTRDQGRQIDRLPHETPFTSTTKEQARQVRTLRDANWRADVDNFEEWLDAAKEKVGIFVSDEAW